MSNFVKSNYDYLVLIFSLVVSAILRIAVPYSMVFQNGKVIYNAADAYYHMRYVDLILSDYPQIQFSDPYLMTSLGVAPLWDLIIAWFGTNIWAAYLPAILGVLNIIPIFVITKQIFKDKLITSVAVFLSAIISGLFFARTQLGAADHHALEIVLLTSIMMWLILFWNSNKIVLCGIYYTFHWLTFALFYLTWGVPSLISVVILCVFSYSQITLKLWNGHRSLAKVLFGLPILIIAIVLLSHLGYFGYLGELVKYAIPLSFQSIIGEEWPLLFSYSSEQNIFMDLSITWGYFGILFFAMLVGIGMLLYRVIKYKHGQDTLLLTWTVVMLVLTLIMRRWAYYFAVNVVILSAFSFVIVLKTLIVIKNQINVRRLVFACVIGVAFVVVPFIRNDIGIARNEHNYVSKGWQEVSEFLRNELTESQDAEYYKVWNDGDVITTPIVLSWWDYGYYLVRESHMRVLSHGGGFGQSDVAKLLLSDDANIVQRLKELNVKYIVIDNRMTVEYFYAIVNLAGDDMQQYYRNDSISKMIVRASKYYDTLLARLYLFNDIYGIDLVYTSSKLAFVPSDKKWVTTAIQEVKVFKIR